MDKSGKKVTQALRGCAVCGEIRGCSHSAQEYRGEAAVKNAPEPQFFYLELAGNGRRPTYVIMERSAVSNVKFNEVARLSSEKQARRMLKLLNALPEDMSRNSL